MKMADETQEFGTTFADYFDSTLLTQGAVPAANATETPAQQTVEANESPEAATEGATANPVDTSERAKDGISGLEIFKQKGLNVSDDTDPNEFYTQAAEQLLAGIEAQRERERLRAEVEQLKASLGSQSQGAPQQPAPAPAPVVETQPQYESKFRKAVPPTKEQWLYAEEGENGEWVPKSAEFGVLAVEAANAINKFLEAKRHNAELLLTDPSVVIEDQRDKILTKAEAQKLFEEQFKAWQDAKVNEEKALAEQAAKAAAQKEWDEFHAANKSKIFHLDIYGEPATAFKGGPVRTTEFGAAFLENLDNLRLEFPGADELKLMRRALAETDLKQQVKAVVTPPAPAPVKPTPDALKEQFLRQRETVARPPVGQSTPAQPEDFENFQNLSFAAAMRLDPDNQNNPIFRQ